MAAVYGTPSSAPSDRRGDGMQDASRQSLLKEIRESEGRQASANPLTGLMMRWLLCCARHKSSNAQLVFMRRRLSAASVSSILRDSFALHNRGIFQLSYELVCCLEATRAQLWGNDRFKSFKLQDRKS